MIFLVWILIHTGIHHYSLALTFRSYYCFWFLKFDFLLLLRFTLQFCFAFDLSSVFRSVLAGLRCNFTVGLYFCSYALLLHFALFLVFAILFSLHRSLDVLLAITISPTFLSFASALDGLPFFLSYPYFYNFALLLMFCFCFSSFLNLFAFCSR